jgi:3-hydroxyisobutyrate dehydrogenase-like beta-hydroxyacid dehydrogenase
VTAAQDKVAARDVAAGLKAGCWFLDLNSASPGQKTEASRIVARADARYVEAAVMSPIGPKRIASPMLLGGPFAQAFLPLAHALGFSGAQFFASEIGKASAAKLCRSVIVKGLEAILSESLLAGRHYGVEETVLAALNDLLPGPSWPTLARYMISRTIQHGVRRAEEMREAASTVSEAGIEPLMSVACSKRQDWAPQFRAALDTEALPEMLDAMLGRIPANEETRDDH